MPRFEEISFFCLIGILVGMFAWIYTIDRQKRIGLWVLGWISLFIHSALPIIANYNIWLRQLTDWMKTFTLIAAGTCFLLSVTEVFLDRYRRLAFIFCINLASTIYVTGLIIGVRATALYVSLLLISGIYGAVEAMRFYGWKTLHRYLLGVLLPYGGWVIYRTLQGSPNDGIDFYLFGLFYATGLAYLRNFRRFSPGVIFTAISFIVWGAAFPVSSRLIGLGLNSVIWNLPTFCVAFGMLFTLMENQTERMNNTIVAMLEHQAQKRNKEAPWGNFYSCFISHSTKDLDFAQRLYTDLEKMGVRCWFAPKDLRIGEKLRSSFDEAINSHDKLLILLSESSLNSIWVEKEVETAFEKEKQQRRTVLLPICLDDAVMETNQAWASDIRRARNIGDFRNWRNPDSYKNSFDRLLQDLQLRSESASMQD
ncbi:MAG TPA: toll/interleukin-1 receptor domain-containing protein [Candidatus Angelobacter sp.]|nr:toll/interleukin-1 receptor domain-containing protein [Candidatus Angelobacter sp.]